MSIEEPIDRFSLHAVTHEDAGLEDVAYRMSKTPTQRPITGRAGEYDVSFSAPPRSFDSRARERQNCAL
jgi:hypothetical protein